MGRGAADIANEVGGLDLAERVAVLLDAATGFAVAREDLETRGIRLVAPGDGIYPDRLLERMGPSAPPMLYTAGPVEWLGASLARSAQALGSETGVVTDGSVAELPALDRAAEAGLPNVAVVADGLAVAGRRKELRRHVGAQRLLLVSPFAPDAIATERTVAACVPIIDALIEGSSFSLD
eukprot:GHVU01056474.1.p2 GENE.GHVU01056474.1~~GHVU01056474.1.p2  ORF type:complete len:180 (+),score=17.49 GHVU01056474.1:742-1281(+)